MITTEELQHALERRLDGSPCFLVSAEVRAGGKAMVEVDRDDTPITLDELTAINKGLREELGTALDDVELQVGSPGLGRPFKVERQYRKYLGRTIEIVLVEGKHVQGVLESYDEEGLLIRVLHPSKIKGRKPKLDEQTTAIARPLIRTVQAAI